MDYRQKAQELFAKVYEADMAAYQKEIERQIPSVIEFAKTGDIDAILKLKDFANYDNEKAKDALEKLYWDGNKVDAIGTVVIREGATKIESESFKDCNELKK